MVLENFGYLLFTHFMADFAFQSDFMSKFKYKLPYVMCVHVFIWTFALYAMSSLLGMFIPLILWPIMAMIHYVCDFVKCDLIEKKYKDVIDLTPVKNLFHIDQAVHIVQIVVLSLFR